MKVKMKMAMMKNNRRMISQNEMPMVRSKTNMNRAGCRRIRYTKLAYNAGCLLGFCISF